MKEQKIKCVFCGQDLSKAKAWPVNIKGKRVWTCAKVHFGVDAEIRRQLMARELGPGANPDNPDYTVVENLAWSNREKVEVK